MNIPESMPRLKRFRFPREIISYALWAYHRFTLSTADVEDLLAERGVIVSLRSDPPLDQPLRPALRQMYQAGSTWIGR